MEKKLTCPPTPAKRRGKGEKSLSEAIRREAMESPDTSPATRKTLSSPSLAAMSIGALDEENENHCRVTIFGIGFGFHFLLNKVLAPNEIGGIQLESIMRNACYLALMRHRTRDKPNAVVWWRLCTVYRRSRV